MSAELIAAREKWDFANAKFRKCLSDAGYRDEWGAFLSEHAWPSELRAAFEALCEARHAFYALRDGPAGFLGKDQTK